MTYRYGLKEWQRDFVSEVAQQADIPMARVIEYVFRRASSDIDEKPREFFRGLHVYLDSLHKD